MRHLAHLLAIGLVSTSAISAEPLGIALENYDYPHPVAFKAFTVSGQDVRMAYMDVRPEARERGVVVLFHGKNFFGAYWKDTITALNRAGYRTIVPDQIGFGKSSKPAIPYSFHAMASQTKALLDELGVSRTAVVGHSMGGMLATRFALMYPDFTSHLILENPLGLEDYRVAPYVPTADRYAALLRTTEEGIRRYHRNYYVEWKDAYEEYVQVHYRWTLGGEYPRYAMSSALTGQMIYEQPVVHELPLLVPKTLLVIGQEDRTSPGRNLVSGALAESMGHYPTLGRDAQRRIPNAELVELANIGHVPHFEAPEAFHEALIDFLATD
jgi:pimeloyl-ACP methyl ester carboxylesterase